MKEDKDRKKKLEDIKKRKQQLASMLNPTSSAALSSAQTTPGEQKPAEAVGKGPRESTMKASSVDYLDEYQKRGSTLRALVNKKFSESLGLSQFTETYPGSHPVLGEKYCQCNLEENENDNALSEEQKKNKENEGRASATGPKGVRSLFKNLWAAGNEAEEVDANKNKANLNKPIKLASEELRKDYIDKKSDELERFMNSYQPMLERALGENDIYDICKTYYYDEEDDNLELLKRSMVTTQCEFFEESCTKRTVTNLEWSSKQQDLLLAAYSKADDSNTNQQNGLIHLWSLSMRKAPEFSFMSQTEITSSIFHKFNPKLVLAGTYTGRVLIFDTRGKSLPIQKTPLGIGGGPSGKTHSHPVCCLGLTGSTNSNQMISISADGVLCTWSLNNLSKPIKRIELKKKKAEDKIGLDELGVLCLGFHDSDSNSLLIGSDDSDIYQIALEANENDIVETAFKGHNGPVHSIDVHPGDFYNNVNLSHLFITSSADWTTRLWTKNIPDGPLLTCDLCDDYVYCSKWHPTNPSVFVTGDGTGKVDFWDLNKDLEAPVVRHEIGKSVVNKLGWSADGKKLAVGDCFGKTVILGIEKELYSSKPEDAVKFEKVISKMKITK